MTKEQLQTIMVAIQEHPDRDSLYSQLEKTICEELEIRGSRLVEAVIQDDIDGIINAFTGWDMEALLEKAQIIPNRSGAWIGHDWNPDDVTFKTMPWEKSEDPDAFDFKFTSKIPVFDSFVKNEQVIKDYTFEVCSECGEEVVIYAKGISICPACGKPIAPCSECVRCGGSSPACANGCNGTHTPTHPPISEQEIAWVIQAHREWLANH